MSGERLSAWERGTVLVVEDDWLLRQALITDLRDRGWRVFEAASGIAALSLLNGSIGRIDLLITDIGLVDEIDGWEIAESYREANPAIAVIYATATPDENARRVPDSEFFAKPYLADRVIEAADRVAMRLGYPSGPRCF